MISAPPIMWTSLPPAVCWARSTAVCTPETNVNAPPGGSSSGRCVTMKNGSPKGSAQAPVHGHFLANLAGPFALAGAGTAFSFIPISIAVLAGVRQHQAGSASGLMNTSVQLGAALGIALASPPPRPAAG